MKKNIRETNHCYFSFKQKQKKKKEKRTEGKCTGNPLTGSVSHTIGRSPRNVSSFVHPPVSRSDSFSLSSSGSWYLLPSRADIRSRQRTRQLASGIRNLRGSMAGRETVCRITQNHPHHWHTQQNTEPIDYNNRGKRIRATDSETVTDTSRETGVAPWLRSEIARDSPRVRFWSLSRVQTRTTGIVFLWILICKRTWPAATIATTANTAGTCWYGLALVIESVFEARVQGRRTINRGVETSHRDDTLWHPPKGAPREPSTSCCQSCRAAAMARASRSQRLRRRHPSHAGDVVAAIPGPYLSYTIFFQIRYIVSFCDITEFYLEWQIPLIFFYFFLRLKLRWPIGNDYEDLDRSSYLWKVL